MTNSAAPREAMIPLTKAGADGPTMRVLRFGPVGARPKVFLQAGLHADELPGLLVLRELVELLSDRHARGEVVGEIVIIPVANPIGLGQIKGEWLVGRCELSSDRNFNRGFPDLASETKAALDGRLGDDAAQNVAAIRAAMAQAIERLAPADAFQALQLCLLAHAFDADIALDLHADNEALLHLYTLPQFWPDASDLAAELDARAVLLCDDSGGSSFDEALSTPWLRLAQAFPTAAIPPACFSATVELRSNNDVDADLAKRDARALERFLIRRGAIQAEIGALPRLLCEATDLQAAQWVKATTTGLVVYRLQLGDRVRKGEVVAEIVPPQGERVALFAETDGVLFARHNQPWAWPGKTIAKIAGKEKLADRVGVLLSP
jgi:uncharacterized protein